MSLKEVDRAWGQLVSLTDLHSAPILLQKDKFSIGRAKGCDFSLGENKLVSGHHCHIERDEDGRVWLCDTSTNGTSLNLTEKVKGEKKELSHGDEIYVVFKKSNEAQNVGLMYQDLLELETEESDSTLDYTNPLEATILDEDANVIEAGPVCDRKRSEPDTPNSPAWEIKKRKTESTQDKKSTESNISAHQEPHLVTSQRKSSSQPGNAGETTTQRKEKSFDARETTPGSGEVTVETKQQDSTETLKGNAPEAKETQSKLETSLSEKKDELAETLVCIICQDILHDCISLQPCLHSFCSGCYSDWMKRSNECPSCRMKVERINRNHMVINLVEAYLREHPEKKRTEEDLKELDGKNQITRDMLYPKTTRNYLDDFVSDEDIASDISTDSFDEPRAAVNAVPADGGFVFGLGTPMFGLTRPAAVLCRQCPGYVDTASKSTDPEPTGTAAILLPGTSDQPSTSSASSNERKDDVKIMPVQPLYRCTANQNHVLCSCCIQPIPDRRTEALTNPAIPSISCTICYRHFCHAYWGCRKADCLGCFGKFGDLNFGKKSLVNLLLDNQYESQVLADYLESHGITVKNMLNDCLVKLEAGEYTCQDMYRHHLTQNSWLCFGCGLKNFKDLAYFYRRDIPQDQLPDTVTGRPDCYWGKNCRTQKNKPHHAQRFNHICAQSRTT